MAVYAQAHAHDCMAAFKAGLGQEYALVLGTVALMEDVDAPTKEYQKAVQKLREIGVEITLEKLLGKTLAHRAASKRYSSKSPKKAKPSDIRSDVRSDVRSDEVSPLSISLSLTPSPAEKEITPPASAPAPAKPKRKPKAVESFDSWMPKDDHFAIAKERKLNMAAEHIAMRDWLASTGKTYKDYDAFARNWLRRATPQRMVPVNTGNSLRQPHPRDIPTDPEEARKYWLGEPDEQRFDWG